jgi:hypothetical protein
LYLELNSLVSRYASSFSFIPFFLLACYSNSFLLYLILCFKEKKTPAELFTQSKRG